MAHISALQLSPPAGNSAIATEWGRGRGGLASTFKPRLRLRPSLPLVLVTVPVVGGSLGVNTTTRQQTTLTSNNVGEFSLPR